VIEGIRVRAKPLHQAEVASRLEKVCVPEEATGLLQNGYLRSSSIQVSWRAMPLACILIAPATLSVLLGLLVKRGWASGTLRR